MSRYLAILILAWKRVWIYRGISLIYLLLSLVNISLTISIWTIAYRSGALQSRENLSLVISYFTVGIVFNQLVSSFTSGVIADEHIRHGELSIYLLRPFPYFLYMLLLEIPWRVMAFLLSLPAVVILYFIYGNLINFQMSGIPLILIFVSLCYLLSFMIQFGFALLTFWFEDTHGILSLSEVLWLLFAGMGVPIFFFPPLLKLISRLLPFQYTVYFIISVVLKRLTGFEFWINTGVLILWLGLIALVDKLIWRVGLKKFTGEGL